MTLATQIIVQLAVYRASIYRLLALLLANQRIAAGSRFAALCDNHANAEIIPLLIQIAAITRQHLEFLTVQAPASHHQIADSICGDFFATDKGGRKLAFKAACNHIVHAQSILLYAPGNDADDNGKTDAPDSHIIKITHVTGKKGGLLKTADTTLDFNAYLEICLTLSDTIEEITS